MRDIRVRFLPAAPLHAELKRRVEEYFTSTGRSTGGGARLWVKTILLLGFTLGTWLLFLRFGGTWWSAILAGAAVGLGVAGLGMCVQHDANHGAFSRRPFWNRTFGYVLDLIGGSSWIWRTKHNQIHHTYPNLVDVDQDLEAGILARLAPGQPRRFFHRFQHLYLWFFYAFLTLKWAWVDDFLNVGSGTIGSHRLRRPRGAEWAVFLGGKAVAFTWSLVIPVLVHGWVIGLLFHVSGHMVAGLVLSTIFQLAHCNEMAEFPDVPTPAGQETEWAVHQLRTAVDFAPRNRPLTWYLGGLNFQAVHHLFPQVSHVHYPALSPIVAAVCAERGVLYRTQPSFRAALGSHVRWLYRMGRS